MQMTPFIQKALNRAALQHSGQFRRGIPYPYIVHPFSVALIVAEYTTDEEIIAAALLHDVLEDTKDYGAEAMAADFSPRVAELVAEVSEHTELPWRERKQRYLEGMKTASEGAVLICAADKLHNLESLRESIATGEERYQRGLRDQLANSGWFYEAVMKLVAERLPGHPLSQRLQETYAATSSLFAARQ